MEPVAIILGSALLIGFFPVLIYTAVGLITLDRGAGDGRLDAEYPSQAGPDFSTCYGAWAWCYRVGYNHGYNKAKITN